MMGIKQRESSASNAYWLGRMAASFHVARSLAAAD
jgi:hypothetical protein